MQVCDTGPRLFGPHSHFNTAVRQLLLNTAPWALSSDPACSEPLLPGWLWARHTSPLSLLSEMGV